MIGEHLGLHLHHFLPRTQGSSTKALHDGPINLTTLVSRLF